jgi:glycosyltransferase involved in cell wall biosynthesis
MTVSASRQPLPATTSSGSRTALPQVVIDLEKLRHFNCGLGRFSYYLGREILRVTEKSFEPVFLLPKGADRYFPEGGYRQLAATVGRKEVVQQLLRPLARPFLRRSEVAVWHVSNQMSRYLPLDPRVPVILTVHDLNFLHESPQADRGREIERKLIDIQRKVDRAAALVTDSQYVADDLTAHVNLGDRRVHVVPLGLGEPPAASTKRPAFLPEGPFLFTVGNCLIHKNFHVLFDLLPAVPGSRLVIAGKKATPYGEHLEREIVQRGLSDTVIMPGEVTDGDRQWLYENCEAFLFPSLTEGFGFPVLEAMQAGRPVFCSRKTSLPEIAGDAASYFDSFDGETMAAVYQEGMHRFMAGPRQAASALREHAAAFSWAETARRYCQVYEAVLSMR